MLDLARSPMAQGLPVRSAPSANPGLSEEDRHTRPRMAARVKSEFMFTTPASTVIWMLVHPTPTVAGCDVVVLRAELLKPLNQPNPGVH